MPVTRAMWEKFVSDSEKLSDREVIALYREATVAYQAIGKMLEPQARGTERHMRLLIRRLVVTMRGRKDIKGVEEDVTRSGLSV